MVSAQYNLATGQITAVVNPSLTNAAQIAALQAQGIGILEVDAGINGMNSIVDLATTSISPIAATPAIPNVMVQFVAAQINNGSVAASAFHPNTLAEMNTSLVAANLTGIIASTSSASGAASALSAPKT